MLMFLRIGLKLSTSLDYMLYSMLMTLKMCESKEGNPEVEDRFCVWKMEEAS